MSTDKLKVFSERLKTARTSQKLSKTAISKALETAVSTVAGWEDGKNFPRHETLIALSGILNVPTAWLMGESEELSPLKPASETVSNARIAQPEKGLRMIPVISHMRAGHGLLDDLTSNYDDLECQIDERIESDCKDPNAFALIVEGDSMEPRFLAGDRVIFAPNETPRTGDFVVARILETGQVLFKKFRQTGRNGDSVLLESLNPAYDALEMNRSVFRFIYPAVDLKSRLRR